MTPPALICAGVLVVVALAGGCGDGTQEDRSTPGPVLEKLGGSPLSGITEISAADDHTCALLEDATARCWGSAYFGQLGDGSKQDRSWPGPVLEKLGSPLSGITEISGSFSHTCALLEDTTARCWGVNREGQLGDGTQEDRSTPVEVEHYG